VGTTRKPVALQIDDQLFVGPDNGIFSLLTEQYDFEAVELTNKKYWRADVSNTFHGRDVFAPVAAHLLNGAELTDLGPSLDDLETYRWAVPIADDDGIEGWVIHIDAFGNLITNISESLIDDMIANNSIKLYVGNTILDNITDTFGSVSDGEPVAYIGSAGMLEIAVNKGDAQKMLGIKKGAQISLVLQKED
jgi:S-adenosylmethionine hydrolase